jgi:hypothetical protein
MKDSVLINETVIQRGSIANVLITILSYTISTLIPNSKTNAYIFDFIFGVGLTYIFDILFVQMRFNDKQNKVIKVPYDDILYRFKHMFNVNIFYKFIIVITIGFLINKSLFLYVIRILKSYEIGQKKEHIYYRDLIINVTLNFFTTLMLLNFMKYKWAYIDSNDTYLTLIILSLFSLSILISVTK